MSQRATEGHARLVRGTTPTARALEKYRAVMATRFGSKEEAVKASDLTCPVAQHVLQRWAGGLSDAEAMRLVVATQSLGAQPLLTEIDALAERWLKARELDAASEPADSTISALRLEAEDRRRRLAALRQRTLAERGDRELEAEQPELSRLSLLEPDPQADPAASIRAWEARQAAARAKAMPQPSQERGAGVATKHKPAIDLVDAQADGLTCRDLALVSVTGCWSMMTASPAGMCCSAPRAGGGSL